MKNKVLILVCAHNLSGDIKLNELRGGASIRLHMRPALNAAQKLGLNPKIVALNGKNNKVINELGNPEVCIINKIAHPDPTIFEGYATEILASTARLKANGCKIILIYSNHHGKGDSQSGELHRNLINLSNHIVVPTSTMIGPLKHLTSRNLNIIVIKDPWQTKLQDYTIPKSTEPLKVAWFGNGPNVKYLLKILPSLMKDSIASNSYQLRVLTNLDGLRIIKNEFSKLYKSSARPWRIQLYAWDDDKQPNQLEEFLGASHVALLPSDPSDSSRSGISHNRMVDAARSGCFVIASGMGSYIELSKLGLIGENHAELLNNLAGHYLRLSIKYSSLRQNLLMDFSPESNSKKWKAILSNTCNI